jgi:hypothetical protein
LSDKEYPLEQKKEILEFAKKLIEHNIFSKRSMKKIMTIARQANNLELTSLAKEIEDAKPKELVKAQDIKYTVNYSTSQALAKEMDKIAKGKTSILKEEDRKFIKNFAQDLTTIASNTVKSINPSELESKGWSKVNKNELSPNIVYSTESFDQLHGFVVNEILARDNPKERDRLYSAFLKIADTLLKKHHNYSSAMAIISALTKPVVERTVSSKLTEPAEELNEIFSDRQNFKRLRDAMQDNEQKGESYIPHFGIVTRDASFMDDGNPEYVENNINFARMEVAAVLGRNLETVQSSLEEKTHLHYDINSEIFQQSYDMDDDRLYERSSALKSAMEKKK